MSDDHEEGSYEEDEEEEEEGFTSSRFEADEGGLSRSYLRFEERVEGGLESPMESRERGTVGTMSSGLTGQETSLSETEEDDSLASAPESEVVGRALSILGLDPDGRLLPLSTDQERRLQSLWTAPGAADLPDSPPPLNNKPLNPNSSLAPRWIRNLDNSVLFQPPNNPHEEEVLLLAVKKNLAAIVNNLSEDQWRYPLPPSFLPTSTSKSVSGLGQEGGVRMLETQHEGYLEREFNPLTVLSMEMGEARAPSDAVEPPRHLWVGEDEDSGLDSDASLRELLNPDPARNDSPNRSIHHSTRSPRSFLPRIPRSANRHAQSSSLAKHVSRLGMAD